MMSMSARVMNNNSHVVHVWPVASFAVKGCDYSALCCAVFVRATHDWIEILK